MPGEYLVKTPQQKKYILNNYLKSFKQPVINYFMDMSTVWKNISCSIHTQNDTCFEQLN